MSSHVVTIFYPSYQIDKLLCLYAGYRVYTVFTWEDKFLWGLIPRMGSRANKIDPLGKILTLDVCGVVLALVCIWDSFGIFITFALHVSFKLSIVVTLQLNKCKQTFWRRKTWVCLVNLGICRDTYDQHVPPEGMWCVYFLYTHSTECLTEIHLFRILCGYFWF